MKLHSHPMNATEEILYEHLSSPPHTATPQRHSPRSLWAAAAAPLHGQSDIAQPASVHCQKGRNNGKHTYSRQKQIIKRSKNSATHDKQPYGGVLLSKTITAPLPPFKQKEKHKRLKAATQRTNPAWSSCYDGSQLSAAAMGKWTPKWRKKGTNTKPFMQMSSPFAVR